MGAARDTLQTTIGLVTPATRHSSRGNRITAVRWAGLLRGLGHRVFVEEEWSGRECDVPLALHARKSAPSVERSKRAHPDRPVIAVLTGTDIYGRIEQDPLFHATLARADRLVVLQPEAVRSLPEAVRPKARVVRQSARPPARRPAAVEDAFEVSVIGHLRDVKDPLRTAMAARLLPAESRVRVLHAGAALDEHMRSAAEEELRVNPRYRWLGPLSHARSVELLARTRLHVLSSRSEGGANVLSEAIACGVPVLSSRIDGSIGILGAAYPGFFEVGDERELAGLLLRAETEPRFLDALREWCRRLAPLVSPERERTALDRLIAEVVRARGASLEGSKRGSAAGAGPRLRRIDADTGLEFTRLAESVQRGLARRPRTLDCRWFYDEEGSRLFERICALPEYYLARAEDEILRQRAPTLAAEMPSGTTLVELGSGSATKTRAVIEALLARQERLTYVMIDVSPVALASSTDELLERYPRLDVVAICAEYEEGLMRLAEETRSPRLVLWLGSNVGNFHRPDAAAFLARVRAILSDSDRLVLGTDLRKDKQRLEAAYDDAAGVTASFEANLLTRIDRELRADFDPAHFRHRASYDETLGRIEMWLVSTRRQRVTIELLDLAIDLEAGEEIHTENSYKYSPDEIEALARASGFRITARWTDREGLFADSVLAPEAGT